MSKIVSFHIASHWTRPREWVEDSGVRHYISYDPPFSLRYDPARAPEMIRLGVYDEAYYVYGYRLRAVYEGLKDGSLETIWTTTGPQDAELPYIVDVEFRLRDAPLR